MNTFTLTLMISLQCITLSLLQITSALQLDGLTTRKSRMSKYTRTTPLPHISTTSLYNLRNENGVTCILMQTDALLSIQYRTTLREEKEASIFLPDDLDITGYCNDDDSSLTMSFSGFQITMLFAKTPGGERWYLSGANMKYSTDNKLLEYVDRPGMSAILATPERTLLFPTPVGKSFTCPKETVLTMSPQDDYDRSGHTAKLYLRNIRLQAFMYKKSNQWGPEFECSATGTYRDETAPLYTGLTLIFGVIVTIGGYAGWRYYKVKNFQYGTMS